MILVLTMGDQLAFWRSLALEIGTEKEVDEYIAAMLRNMGVPGTENFDMSNFNSTPNPGSPEAVSAGCTCPVMDNAHGKGFMFCGQLAFYMAGDCPLHGDKKNYPEDKKQPEPCISTN